jgi:hypothetical protein
MMARIRLAVGILALSLGVSLIAVAAQKTAAPAATAVQLRQKVVAFAGGPGALAKVHTWSFDFVSHPDAKTSSVHHHAYDRDKGVYKYATSLATLAKTPFWNQAAGGRWTPDPKVPKGKELVAIFDHYPRLEGTVYIDGKPQSGEGNLQLLRRVNDSIDNDRYWAFVPLIIANPQIHVDLVAPVEVPGFGKVAGFTAWSGTNKAQNRTLWTLYVTPKGELARTDVMVLHNDKPVSVLPSKWQQFGPVKIALQHTVPAMHRGFEFQKVTIDKPVDTAPPK